MYDGVLIGNRLENNKNEISSYWESQYKGMIESPTKRAKYQVSITNQKYENEF